MFIKSIKTKKKSTENRQWAEKYENLISGCAHDCKYCYAKSMAIHYKQNTPDNWKNEVIRNSDLLKKGFRKRNELIMFPSVA